MRRWPVPRAGPTPMPRARAPAGGRRANLGQRGSGRQSWRGNPGWVQTQDGRWAVRGTAVQKSIPDVGEFLTDPGRRAVVPASSRNESSTGTLRGSIHFAGDHSRSSIEHLGVQGFRWGGLRQAGFRGRLTATSPVANICTVGDAILGCQAPIRLASALDHESCLWSYVLTGKRLCVTCHQLRRTIQLDARRVAQRGWLRDEQ
jgi:hypothetical protein